MSSQAEPGTGEIPLLFLKHHTGSLERGRTTGSPMLIKHLGNSQRQTIYILLLCETSGDSNEKTARWSFKACREIRITPKFKTITADICCEKKKDGTGPKQVTNYFAAIFLSRILQNSGTKWVASSPPVWEKDPKNRIIISQKVFPKGTHFTAYSVILVDMCRCLTLPTCAVAFHPAAFIATLALAVERVIGVETLGIPVTVVRAIRTFVHWAQTKK